MKTLSVLRLLNALSAPSKSRLGKDPWNTENISWSYRPRFSVFKATGDNNRYLRKNLLLSVEGQRDSADDDQVRHV